MNDPLNSIDPDLNLFDTCGSTQCFSPTEFNSQYAFNSEFSMIHFNARSLSKNFEDISLFLSSLKHSFTVIAISETWISNAPVFPFNLPGYKFIHSDRISGRGGGVGLFIKNDILFQIRTDISFVSENDSNFCEYLFIDFMSDNSKYTIGVIYRKPDLHVDDFIEFYTNTLRKITAEQRNVFIAGDFNIDLLKCIENLDANKFSTANFLFGFDPLIKSATRITLNSATRIDNFFNKC